MDNKRTVKPLNQSNLAKITRVPRDEKVRKWLANCAQAEQPSFHDMEKKKGIVPVITTATRLPALQVTKCRLNSRETKNRFQRLPPIATGGASLTESSSSFYY